jgi:ethanolamine utilization protein EutA
MTDEAQGGRVFFSSTGRSLVDEDEIVVLSVGVDIGSSTSHLVFSRIVLERLDSRYVVTKRETFHQSDILLTPYSAGETIDADALGAFIERQYKTAKIDPDEIDTGALILTGVAVRRSNARAIGELFARQTGKMVAVSAGDSLETVMAAFGSGALDPRRHHGNERGYRRRHLQDRRLHRRQGCRPHRRRRRRATRMPG